MTAAKLERRPRSALKIPQIWRRNVRRSYNHPLDRRLGVSSLQHVQATVSGGNKHVDFVVLLRCRASVSSALVQTPDLTLNDMVKGEAAWKTTSTPRIAES